MTCETPVKSVTKCEIRNAFDRVEEVQYLKIVKVQTITTVMIYVIKVMNLLRDAMTSRNIIMHCYVVEYL